MNNYWPLSEFGFSIGGSDFEKIERVSIAISGIADYFRKSVNCHANLELSTEIRPDLFISFHMISGICQVGLYDSLNNTLTQDADISLFGNIDIFEAVLLDLHVNMDTMVQDALHGQNVQSKRAVVRAWREIDISRGISTDIEDLSYHPNIGFTVKDILPFQQNALISFDMYLNNSDSCNILDSKIASARKRTDFDNLENCILALSQHVDITKNKLFIEEQL